MNHIIEHVVVLGGGSAGWISAGLIASKLKSVNNKINEQDKTAPIKVTLVESPDVKTIGVGEGSWPTLRHTLKSIGISETTFIRECDASFKQGTEFLGWTNGHDRYYHPFTVPFCYPHTNTVQPLWEATAAAQPFANFASPQGPLCDSHKAPKSINEPEYAGFVNYGYHFNADKLGALLKQHCIENLNVEYISDHVSSVEPVEGIEPIENRDIAALHLSQHGRLSGDLFIDCSGLRGVLIDHHYNVPWHSQQKTLFNNRALAVQMPYKDESQPIPSCTKSTAQDAGWIWDIALQNRRGTGLVYSSDFLDTEQAKSVLKQYLSNTNTEQQLTELKFREIQFNPGYRKTFWHKNCVAVGLSSGFIEPLEASAIVMVELSAQFIADHLPSSRGRLDIVAKKFNQLFSYRWQQIIDFLKYHYVLSERQTPYWLAHQNPESIPDTLKDTIALWQEQEPNHKDLWHNDEIFSAASYQYVLFGMKGISSNYQGRSSLMKSQIHEAHKQRQQLDKQTQQLTNHLPNNRDLLALLSAQAFK